MAQIKRRHHPELAAARAAALGTLIRQARQRAGRTQEEVSAASGLSVVHLQRLERGTANPTLATLYCIADALGLLVRDMLPD